VQLEGNGGRGVPAPEFNICTGRRPRKEKGVWKGRGREGRKGEGVQEKTLFSPSMSGGGLPWDESKKARRERGKKEVKLEK